MEKDPYFDHNFLYFKPKYPNLIFVLCFPIIFITYVSSFGNLHLLYFNYYFYLHID